MLGYYFELAFLSLRRNAALTALTVIAVGVGIGASMTVFTMFRALSGDPIPEKSAQLFIALVDNWGPASNLPERWRSRLSYTDATALMRAKHAARQSAMYGTVLTVTPAAPSMTPSSVSARATYADFFPMFDVPFRAGGPWTHLEDDQHANVVVLSGRLADRLFAGENPIGRQIRLNELPYRVVGVLRDWDPQPHFYDLQVGTEDIYIPFTTAIERQMYPGDSPCNSPPPPGWSGLLSSECIWVGFWVELPTAAAVAGYRQFLSNYTMEQRRVGRFHWPPGYSLYDVREWLIRQKVVPDEVRVATLVAFGFLAVCLLNAVSLMLGKFAARVGHLSVHRALGASRMDVFIQCMAETGVIGLTGGLLGILLTLLGLHLERAIVEDDLRRLTHLDGPMTLITLCLAVVATLGCGIYPSWRASRTRPALQLKAQ